MKKTEIEVKECENVSKQDNTCLFYDEAIGFCVYYDCPVGCLLGNKKPDFCKVKRIIVEEGE